MGFNASQGPDQTPATQHQSASLHNAAEPQPEPSAAYEAARPDRSVRPGTQECVRHELTEIVARGEDIQV
jgi:hypothetical protein